MIFETILTFILIILAIVFIGVGVYLILVLGEIRDSLRHVNKVIGHIDSLTRFLDEKVARPVGSVASVAKVFNDLVDVLKEFKQGRRRKKDE